MIEGINFIELTPAGLLLLAVLMVFTGRLVPRVMYLEKVKEADQWRAAYDAERAARAISDAQTRELLEVAKTSQKILTAVHEYSEQIKSGDS